MKVVVMAGGRGSRFWPLSRRTKPKQFLTLTGGSSLLQATVERLEPLVAVEDIYVVAGREYVEPIRRQLPQLHEDQLIVEPVARNTAPCIGLAAHYLYERGFAQEAMAVLPADHLIKDVSSFQRALKRAEKLAREGWLMTFGIEPSYAATGFGYLKRGAQLADEGVFKVAEFAEKPSRELAERYLASGDYFWNSGMFVWSVARIIEEIGRLMPDLAGRLEAMRGLEDEQARKAHFSRAEKISIDYGVMERTDRAALIVCDLGWNDVGSWKALPEILEPDSDGHVVLGQLEALESRDCVVVSEPEKMVALIGVRDLVVVDTEDALLVCSGDRTEEVKAMVRRLEGRKDEVL